jgi:prepilin-type N-terminal cleavage/methylation domain-containing protein
VTTTSATGETSPVDSRGGGTRSGFTLVEIVIVMVIISLVIGLLVPSIADLLKYEELRGVAAETSALVKTARREAVIQKRDLWIEFDGLQIRVFPMEAPDLTIHEISTGKNLRCLVKSWGQTEWQKFSGQRIRVTDEGILQPFEVLYRHDEAWISYRYDPLTGGVAEEENYFP